MSYLTLLDAARITGAIPDNPRRVVPPDEPRDLDRDIDAADEEAERAEAMDPETERLFERAWEEVDHVPR